MKRRVSVQVTVQWGEEPVKGEWVFSTSHVQCASLLDVFFLLRYLGDDVLRGLKYFLRNRGVPDRDYGADERLMVEEGR